VEDIVTELSRFRNLFVISRNSSFTYKGRTVEIKQVGRELGVRYVLEGSVRRAADRVRITAQLIDAVMEGHLWADRFEGALEHIFELQDRVTVRVVGAIAPKLEQAEIERAKRKPTDSLDAYDCYLRAHASIHPWTRAGNEEALRLFYRAIELDPAFASAYGMAAWCRVQRKASGWMRDRAGEIAETRRLALRAAELGNDDAATLGAAGFALVYVVHDVEPGVAFIDRALELNPNLAWVWLYSGWSRVWLGKPERALEHLARATRLSPLDPLISDVQVAIAHAHFFCGRYEEAASWTAKVVDLHSALYHIAAAANALAGHMAEARKACERLRQLHPALRVADVRQALGPYRPEDLAKYEDGLRKAGLPE
jgi:tetratricopeptide (TPR) repeat protein